jgi:ABC-type transport system involved in cytochrome c biogenesis permease subunit
MQIYGLVILSFMAGVIWGFATKADGRQAGLFYALVGIAADLGVLALPQVPTGPALAALLAGFVALLPIDWTAARGPRAAMVDATEAAA